MGNICCPDSSTKNQSTGLNEPLVGGGNNKVIPAGAGSLSPNREMSPPPAGVYAHPAQGPCPPRSTSYADATIVPETAVPPQIQQLFDKITDARAALRTAGRSLKPGQVNKEVDAQCDKIRALVRELLDDACKRGALRCVLVARCMGAMGHTFISINKVEEGIGFQRRALEEHRYLNRDPATGMQGDHADIATALDRVGVSIMNNAHNVASQVKEAISYLSEALDMRRRLHGVADHDDVAQSLNAVGVALEAIGNERDGCALQKEGLEMYQRIKGANKTLEDLDAASNIVSPVKRANSGLPGKGAAAPTAAAPANKAPGNVEVVVRPAAVDGGISQADADDL